MMSKKNPYLLLSSIALGIILYSCNSMNKVTNSFSKKEQKMVASPSSKANPINGKWLLNYITGPRITFEGLYPNKKPFLVLDTAKMQLSGNTGCNNFSGSFKIVEDSIQLGQLATTMMACVDGGQGETVFLGTLGKISHYKVSGDTLWLRFKKLDAMRFVRDTSVVK